MTSTTEITVRNYSPTGMLVYRNGRHIGAINQVGPRAWEVFDRECNLVCDELTQQLAMETLLSQTV